MQCLNGGPPTPTGHGAAKSQLLFLEAPSELEQSTPARTPGVAEAVQEDYPHHGAKLRRQRPQSVGTEDPGDTFQAEADKVHLKVRLEEDLKRRMIHLNQTTTQMMMVVKPQLFPLKLT